MQPLAPPPRLLHCCRRRPKTPYKQPLIGSGRPVIRPHSRNRQGSGHSRCARPEALVPARASPYAIYRR